MGLLSLFGSGKSNTATDSKPSSIFSNPFFSIAGQKERLTNVAQTIKSAFTGGGVSVTPKARKVIGEGPSKVIESIASHPYAAAGVASVIKTAAPYVTKAISSTQKSNSVLTGGGLLKTTPTNTPPIAEESQAQAIIQDKKDNTIFDTVIQTGQKGMVGEYIGIKTTKTKTRRKKAKKRTRKRKTKRRFPRRSKSVSRRNIQRKRKKKNNRGSGRSRTRKRLKFGSLAYRKKYLGHK